MKTSEAASTRVPCAMRGLIPFLQFKAATIMWFFVVSCTIHKISFRYERPMRRRRCVPDEMKKSSSRNSQPCFDQIITWEIFAQACAPPARALQEARIGMVSLHPSKSTKAPCRPERQMALLAHAAGPLPAYIPNKRETRASAGPTNT